MNDVASAYRIGETIGQGAIASVVYVHGTDGRRFAGKVLHDSHALDAAASARFAQEARLLREVEHPNLVGVHGLVRIDDREVLLMDLVEGPTVAEVIARDAPMAEERIVSIGRGIAAGLARAHAAGIVHRDLKPANVLLDGDTPRIADFGMARATSIAGTDRRALTILGTPDYMAPESVDPLAVDSRTDLYALGCILYEMAAGRPPYVGATPFAVLAAHRHAPIPELGDTYDPALRKLVHLLLSKSPADRPQAAPAVVDALDRIARREGSTALVVDPSTARCPSCNEPVVRGTSACLICGTPVVHLEPGEHTLLVVGPGDPGDKLDSQLRERLRDWLRDNEALGLQPARALDRRIPRVPFTLAVHVSESSAATVVRALGVMGLQAAVVRGGPMKHAAMRTKVRSLMRRTYAIAITSMAGLWHATWLMGVASVALVAVGVGTYVTATRRVTTRTGVLPPALPAALQSALRRAETALPAIEHTRHRHGLRAVVARATALSLSTQPGVDAELDAELADAIDAATAAAGRLDALDRRLADLDRDASDDQARQWLHERDTWSARLLTLTATLEALQARVSRASAVRGSAEDAEALDDLRAQVEAFEEVQHA